VIATRGRSTSLLLIVLISGVLLGKAGEGDFH